jgi:DNA primase
MNIDQANEIPAGLWLEVMENIHPVKTSSGGDEHFYHSPLRDDDHNPSFVWSAAKNVWIDNGTNEGGRTFALIKALRHTTAKDTLAIIRDSGLYGKSYNPTMVPTKFSGTGKTSHLSRSKSLKLVAAVELKHPALLKYLKDRGINPNLQLVHKYLREVHYETTNGHHFYGVGIEAGDGGYAISSSLKSGKGFVGPHLTFSHLNEYSGPEILVFEGFIDAFTFLSRYPAYQTYPIVILNSANLANQASDVIKTYEAAQLWLDNDAAGDRATTEIQQQMLSAKDMRLHLCGSNDVNAWITGSVFER